MGFITEYPEFSGVDLNVAAKIETYTRQYPPYSDFNAVNTLCWNNDESARVTNLHGNLAMRLPDYLDGAPFYSFLGDKEVAATARILLDEAERTTGRRTLRLVPEVGALALRETGAFTVTEDPDGHDYVLSLADVAAKSGKKYIHMRQEVNYFANHYGAATSFEWLDCARADVRRDIYKVFLGREQHKAQQGHDNAHEAELVALDRLFMLVNPAKLAAYGLRIEDDLRAFIICETIDEEWVTGHFWKADTAYRGIYRYLMWRTALRLSHEGYSKLNIEQDLGIAGLKRMKQLFGPVTVLKKYTVSDGPV
ncbi:MAG TPA: phosphatidylglycerol lysyltransferase domain-containing protein [Candidatus Saccharimonadales bacterium]|nr:phosphatidylglycerol lysyltransferase domain-containing protein [Candidatus Saccharimonadales bacterium]